MKAEVKFCATKNGSKAFVNTYDDNWKSSNEPLLAYRKDMRRSALLLLTRRAKIIGSL